MLPWRRRTNDNKWKQSQSKIDQGFLTFAIFPKYIFYNTIFLFSVEADGIHILFDIEKPWIRICPGHKNESRKNILQNEDFENPLPIKLLHKVNFCKSPCGIWLLCLKTAVLVQLGTFVSSQKPTYQLSSQHQKYFLLVTVKPTTNEIMEIFNNKKT